MVCPLFLHQEQEKRWERETERKIISELDDSFWFLDRMRYWFVHVDRKRSLTLSFPLLLTVHCTCAGEKEVERAQDSRAFQMGALEERFRRSETLRVSLPFLSKSLKKALLYRCEKAKVHTCMATESKQIPGLVMAKLGFPLLVVSSCFRRLYGGPAYIWRVASNGRFFFERLQRANGSRVPVDLLVDHCMRNLCNHWNTRQLITTTSGPPLSPTRSAACNMPWGVGRKSFIPTPLSARSPNHHLARCAR